MRFSPILAAFCVCILSGEALLACGGGDEGGSFGGGPRFASSSRSSYGSQASRLQQAAYQEQMSRVIAARRQAYMEQELAKKEKLDQKKAYAAKVKADREFAKTSSSSNAAVSVAKKSMPIIMYR